MSKSSGFIGTMEKIGHFIRLALFLVFGVLTLVLAVVSLVPVLFSPEGGSLSPFFINLFLSIFLLRRFFFHKNGGASKPTYVWVCPKCKTRNDSGLQACTKCGTHR